jgi:hypothetical protein
MKILKEDLGTGLLAMAAFGLAMHGLKYILNLDKGIPGQKDKPLPNDNVIQAINDMWENKPFVKDFAEILSDEGDFDKIAADFRNVKVSDESDLYQSEKIWKLINAPNFKPNSTAKKVVEKLLKTSSYRNIKRKYKLTKEDEQYFSKLMLYTIMDSSFTNNAKKFILKTLPKYWIDRKPKVTGIDITRSSSRF